MAHRAATDEICVKRGMGKSPSCCRRGLVRVSVCCLLAQKDLACRNFFLEIKEIVCGALVTICYYNFEDVYVSQIQLETLLTIYIG